MPFLILEQTAQCAFRWTSTTRRVNSLPSVSVSVSVSHHTPASSTSTSTVNPRLFNHEVSAVISTHLPLFLPVVFLLCRWIGRQSDSGRRRANNQRVVSALELYDDCRFGRCSKYGALLYRKVTRSNTRFINLN